MGYRVIIDIQFEKRDSTMDCPTNLLSSSDYLGRQRWFNRRARGRTVERHNALISRVEQVACACVRVRGVAWRRRFCCSRPRSLDNKIGSRTRAITHEYSLVQNCEVSLQVHSRLQRWMLSGIINAIPSSLKTTVYYRSLWIRSRRNRNLHISVWSDL